MKPRIFERYEDLAGRWRAERAGLGKVVFTNGCFDILHAGHVAYLEEARAQGEFLVVGLNRDGSVRRLKGSKRPLNPFRERARVLAGLRAVDLVVGFEQDTPLELIRALRPDVLVKGGDWQVAEIVGAEDVLARGGAVKSLSFAQGLSTTSLVDKIARLYGGGN